MTKRHRNSKSPVPPPVDSSNNNRFSLIILESLTRKSSIVNHHHHHHHHQKVQNTVKLDTTVRSHCTRRNLSTIHSFSFTTTSYLTTNQPTNHSSSSWEPNNPLNWINPSAVASVQGSQQRDLVAVRLPVMTILLRRRRRRHQPPLSPAMMYRHCFIWDTNNVYVNTKNNDVDIAIWSCMEEPRQRPWINPSIHPSIHRCFPRGLLFRHATTNDAKPALPTTHYYLHHHHHYDNLPNRFIVYFY